MPTPDQPTDDDIDSFWDRLFEPLESPNYERDDGLDGTEAEIGWSAYCAR